MKIRLFVLIVSFIAVALNSANAQAQQATGFVEYEHVIVDGKSTPEVNVYAHGPLRGKFGWTAWTLTTQPWSEGLAGLTYAPAKWVELSGTAGIETADDPLRLSASVWAGKGKFAILSIVENGGSGEWHKNLATFQASGSFAVGIFNQRYVGTGPYAEIKRKKITAWGTWVGGRSGALGGRFNF